MTISVSRVSEATEEICDALNSLVPQLSTSASSLSLRELTDIVASPTVNLLIAHNDRLIVGTLTLIIFQIPSGLRAWIEDVIVDKDSRALGVGEKLIQFAIDLAHSKGVRSIDLTSRPSRESANRLYQRLGFTIRETNVYRFAAKDPIQKEH